MSDQSDSGARSFGRRLEQWVRDSAELRAMVRWGRNPATPEEAALARYRRSRTGEVSLPHPGVSAYRYQALGRRQRTLVTRMLVMAGVLAPLLVVLGVVLDPVAAQVAAWVALAPILVLLARDAHELTRTGRERHLSLKGGLADAWSDWVDARDQLEALDGASQARAALGANEARMHTLVLSLGRAEARPDHQDTEEHVASREWVYRSAAKASALAAAEQELEATARRQVDSGELRLAPDGDLDSLDHALDSTRALTQGLAQGPDILGPDGRPLPDRPDGLDGLDGLDGGSRRP